MLLLIDAIVDHNKIADHEKKPAYGEKNGRCVCAELEEQRSGAGKHSDYDDKIHIAESFQSLVFLAGTFCEPLVGASKAGPCPNKLLKISALSGKMTVYKDSHRQEVAKAHGAAAAMKKERVFGERGLTA